MGKKRKAEPKAVLAKAEEVDEDDDEELGSKMSLPAEKRKKESGSVTPRHLYTDSDCESGNHQHLPLYPLNRPTPPICPHFNRPPSGCCSSFSQF
jgi:hypothetical protein